MILPTVQFAIMLPPICARSCAFAPANQALCCRGSDNLGCSDKPLGENGQRWPF
jgi:hypothetical protein